MRRLAALLAVALGFTLTPTIPGTSTPVATAAASDVIAVVVEGTGFGHGRGMSQYGAYGHAVDWGWNLDQILDHYYGGTVMGTVDPNAMTSVRLMALDNQPTIGLVSHGGGVTWNGITRPSMRAVRVPAGHFDVYGSNDSTCAAGSEYLGTTFGTPGPTFTTPNGGAPSLTPTATLGVCQPNGSLIHYRGSIDVIAPPEGLRVVNRLRSEDYLRGVVPREIFASWADAGGGAGRHAVQAQAVAARSYSTIQNRYAYAKTCDTTTCQAYGGAATRASATTANIAATIREDPRTDSAIAATVGTVRKWPNGTVVSTEFSSSNGPRTAGGAFPPVDDWGDATASNPNHMWTRVFDADVIAQRYGLGTLTSATMVEAADANNRQYDGIWFNDVLLNGSVRVPAWDFRGHFGLLSPGFTIRVVTRDSTDKTFGMIGDSVGNSVAGSATAELPTLTDGTFTASRFDVVDGRCTVNTACPGTSGVEAVASLPLNLDLVVVQLGYNDSSPAMPTAIDAMMEALTARGARQVAWVNLAAATGLASNAATYAQRNAALQDATRRWRNLTIVDWNVASNTPQKSRWFSADGIHLRETGQAQFALFVRQAVIDLAARNAPFRLAPPRRLEIPVVGERVVGPDGTILTIPSSATAVALNATAVLPTGSGFVSVWPCGMPRPIASSLNFARGGIDSNGLIAPVGADGKVCLYSHWDTDVVVDVTGWFGPPDSAGSGLVPISPYRVADSRNGTGMPIGRIQPGTVVPLQITGLTADRPSGGWVTIPPNATAAAINLVVDNPADAGFLTVWPCGQPKPVASNLNYAPRAIRANGAIVQLGAGGTICVSSHQATDIVVDITGWMMPGASVATSAFVPIAPDRWVDTRIGLGAPRRPVSRSGPLAIQVVGRNVVVAGQSMPIPADAEAVAVNVVAVTPAQDGFTTMWPCGAALPTASSINYAAGSITANNAIVPVGAGGSICLYVHTDTDVVVDVTGWFAPGDGFTGVVPDRLVDSRFGIGPRPV